MLTVPSTFKLDHLQRLSNHIGICQHASYHIPNYYHGYCLDDNARSFQLLLQARYIFNTDAFNSLIDTYLAYILYMQKENGEFHNFLSFDLKFLDEIGTPDSYGRSIMALGSCFKYDHTGVYIPLCTEIFNKAIAHIYQLKSIRAIAYSLVGLIWALQSKNHNANLEPYILHLADYIVQEYNACGDQNWNWYEEIISYDNAIIPYALLLTYDTTGNSMYKKIAEASIAFLDKILFENNYLKLIGNNGWYKKGDLNDKPGEQPIEIPSLILMYSKAKEIGIDRGLRGNAEKCYQWFFGLNSGQQMLYNPSTKGCHDGLENNHVNLNQGAESTIAFWESYLYHKHKF